jgi:hypothetical protein
MPSQSLPRLAHLQQWAHRLRQGSPHHPCAEGSDNSYGKGGEDVVGKVHPKHHARPTYDQSSSEQGKAPNAITPRPKR